MKNLILSTTAIVALASGTASAADMALKGPRVAGAPFTCAAQQFAGAHIGIHGGGLYHEAKRGDTDGFLTDNSGWTLNHWGGHAGGGIGYDWATCSTVWGIEIDGSGVFGTRNFLPDDPNGGGNIADGITTRVDAMATARIRTGVALDNLLLYVTGGVAGARFRTTWSDGANSVDVRDWRWGWTAGFGTEWVWTQNLSLKSEVLYANFTDRDHSATFTGTTFNFRHSDSLWVSRIGLTYRFGAR